MIKLLVTGANGQLGSAIKKLSPLYESFSYHYSDLPDLDLSDRIQTEKAIEKIKPSYIINCAAYTAVDKAEEDRETAFMVNSEVVKNLIEICDIKGIKLIHISTDYVFNGETHTPYKEDDITNPASIYGLSKLKGEEYLKNNANAMVIRTSWLYSSDEQSFVKKILGRAEKFGRLKVIYDQIGSPTYVMDLAGAILEIIHKVEAEKYTFVPGTYHYTNEGIASWYDFAVEIIRLYGSECPISPVESHEFPSPARRPHYSVLSKQKIKDIYQINIPHWRDSLEKFIKESVSSNTL